MIRDYKKEPLKKIKINTPTGYTYEKPHKEDLEYLYLEQNLTTKELQDYFGLSRRIVQSLLKHFNIKKSKEKRIENSVRKIHNMTPDDKKKAVEKAKLSKLQKWGNENYNNRTKAKETCLTTFGVENVNQRHLPKETIKIVSDKTLLKKFIEEQHILNSTELSNKLNMSEPQIARYILKYDLKYLFDYSKSYLEKEIKQTVMKHHELLNNIKIPNTNLEIDIYIPTLKLGIEINGNYWHGELNKDRLYHIKKSTIAEKHNIFLYHIFEYEWNNKKEQILNQLNNLLLLNDNKIYARHCEIREVSNIDKTSFLEKNHLQGDDVSSIKLGLYYKDELVSIMTFVKPRFNKKYQWELSRFCSKAGCNVVGGASKLFKHFIREYNPDTIISYSNNAHTKGELYKMLQFEMISISNPNYIWYKSGQVLSRYQCQKHKLLEQGYIGNSEIEIMHNLGYYRIFDCGNKVWLWNKKER
jgi:hypothetical protein